MNKTVTKRFYIDPNMRVCTTYHGRKCVGSIDGVTFMYEGGFTDFGTTLKQREPQLFIK